jgi:hypothetical protein
MTRARFTLGVAILATGIAGGCAHFWTIPGEPLATEEICARAEAAHARSVAPGVGYRTGYLKNRLSAEALYNQAMVDRLAAPGLISQANSLLKQDNRDWMSASDRRSSGPGYWVLRCREARERDEREALDRDTAILTP